jgi:hypothetical protein
MFNAQKSHTQGLIRKAFSRMGRLQFSDLCSFVFWVDVLSLIGLLFVVCMMAMVVMLSVTTTWAQDKNVQFKGSADLNADQRLQAVRESLVQLALEGLVKQ